MKKKWMTRLDAAHEWVREFNAIDQSILQQYFDDCSLSEVTVPSKCDRVYVYETGGDENYGEITGYNEESEMFTVELDSGEEIEVASDGFEVERDGGFPMWSRMWSFGDSCDDWWLEECDGIRIMSDCGFRIYSHEEFGYFFGIDGCAYDFYEAHWLPLYNKRGLQWHDRRTDDPEYEPDYDPVYKAYELLTEAGESDMLKAVGKAIAYLKEEIG